MDDTVFGPPMGAGNVADDDEETLQFADEADDDEPCSHDCDEACYGEWDEWLCTHSHCFACGGCRCPGYCDDHQTYNLRPSETGGQP